MSGVRILLVEDDPDVLAAYSGRLRAAGHHVDTADDGLEALGRLRPGSHDLVVSDIGMPRLGGLGLLRAIRERDLDVAVILMTAAPRLDTALSAVEHGAAQYLVKPVAGPELEAAVIRAAQLGMLARARRRAAVGIDETLDARFRRALDGLELAWQPIVRLAPTRGTHAYEALMRTSEASLRSPPDFLDAAERLGRLSELGQAIRRRAAEEAHAAPEGSLVFVNLHASDLADAELYAARAPLSAIADRVVLEITERASLESLGDVPNRIRRLRDMGYRIAVDDLGAGYAGLNSVVALSPDVVKLDMSLVRGLDHDRNRQEVVHAMVSLASTLGMGVIAEGVETPEERAALESIGCALMQGWHFGRPARGFQAPSFD